MAERELDSFSKEALVAFIRQRLAFGSRNWQRDLEDIERNLELDRLGAEAKRLIEESGKLHGIENVKQYLAVQQKLDKVWARQDELLKQIVP